MSGILFEGSLPYRDAVAPRSHGRTLQVLEPRRYPGGAPFYSPARLNAHLGAADHLIVHTRVFDVTGDAPTLTVVCEDSPDGVLWTELNTLVPTQRIDGTTRTLRGTAAFPHGGYVRLRFVLEGNASSAILSVQASLKDD